MNKTELITYLRKPNQLTPQQLDELEGIVNEHPYFLSARLLLAKASKETKHPKTKNRVASAAIYSTDRILLKKYLSSDLFFLKEVPKPEEEENTTSQTPTPEAKRADGPEKEKIEIKRKPVVSDKAPPKESAPEVDQKQRSKPEPVATSKDKEKKTKPQPEVPDLPSGQLDSILDELKRDMDNLKSSREKFAQVQEKIVEDDAVSEALKKAEHKDEEPTKADVVADKEEAPESTEEATASTEIAPESSVATPEIEHDESKQEDQVEEAKLKALEITRAIIEKAKSEVQEEEEDKAKAKEIIEDISSSEQETEPVKEPTPLLDELLKEKDPTPKEPDTASTSDTDVPTKDVEKEEEKEKEEDERAERTIREPRFSRFESRSFLEPPKDFDTSFLDEDKDEKKKPKKDAPEKVADEKTEDKEVTDSKKDSDPQDDDQKGKIKLPDLSKAKPVQRKSKRKTAKEKEEKEEKVDLPKETENKEKDTPEKEAAAKKSPAKKETTAKKEAAKKETAAKKTAAKSTKKETPAKSTKKEATAKKSTKKEAAPKKTVAKKATATKASAAKKTSAKKESTTKKTTKAKSTKTKSTKKDDKKDDGKSDRKSQSDIIDKFIKESPSIKYQRQEEGSGEDLSENSGEWDTNLASEYLAEIYLNQGNKKRAIQIYEALILKYPEKKSYFADLISKIK